jgi:predicted nucleotidyltransferase
MRPIPQSYLQYPLSALLGSEASVRILRELALHGAELTVSAIARRTGVTQQSVRNVLGNHAVSPLIRRYGQGRAASYSLDPKHPLARILIGLFEAEDHRARDIQNQIRAVAERFEPTPLAVWMFGSVARGEDQPLSDLDLLLVVRDDSTTERDAGLFRQEMDALASAHGITISVVPVSGRDVERLAVTRNPFWAELLRDALALHGRSPEDLLSWLKRGNRPSIIRGGDA